MSSDLAVRLLEAVIDSGDRGCLEGNNQKHADFLALAHMLQGCFAEIDARSVDDFRTLDGVSSWLSKHAQQT